MKETLDVDVQELRPEEWEEMLNAMARHYFQMSGDEFRAAWSAGAFDDDLCRPGLQKVAMLLPAGDHAEPRTRNAPADRGASQTREAEPWFAVRCTTASQTNYDRPEAAVGSVA